MRRILIVIEGPTLSVRNLKIRAGAASRHRTLVDGISFDLGAERVALVGESGSGKSLTARAIFGLLPPSLRLDCESLRFEGRELQGLAPRERARLRGARMSLVLQDPRHALNPVLAVRRQVDEILRLHGERSAARRAQRMEAALLAVGIEDPGRVLDAYPHELSGGIGQRVMLAMMLVNGPRLLVADEPTSALDAGLRDQALDLMSGLVRERKMGLLLISHDLRQVARVCDRVIVMYRGRLVETLPVAQLAASRHPYTRTLWSCQPSAATYGTDLPVYESRGGGDVEGPL
jgi:peptide/nickel transport system ATP-binding protein